MAEWLGQASATEDAVKFLRSKVPMLKEEYDLLEDAARSRAFTVAGVMDLDLVTEVWQAVEAAVRDGLGLQDFRDMVAEKLEDAWGEENPSRLETIFRTNVQSAYSAGRYIQNNRPEVRATHPYSKFSAVMDGRTSEICAALDGTVLPSDDDFWASHQPPLHFNCRSDVTAITEDEAKGLGIDDVPPSGGEPDEGFGDVLAHFEPDLSTRPTELVHLYELKQQ